MTFRRRPKIFISAGESSGDTHGAALALALRRRGLEGRFFGLGGDRLAAAGVELLGHIEETAVMGLVETFGSLGRILAVRRRLKRALELERPDLALFIDSPDLNLPLARHASEDGAVTVYYICPSVWAWRAGRLKTLAAVARRRIVLFPFEKKFYEERGVAADWVGHPVADDLPPPLPLPAAKAAVGADPERKLLALLPGSRRPVVASLAPVFLRAAAGLLERDPGLDLILPRADTIPPDFLAPFLEQGSARARPLVVAGRSREVLAAADAALVASGTSSVEAVFLGTPHVAAYKLHPLSWFLARRLVSAPFASLANLAAGREIVPELLQDKATPENIIERLWPLLADPEARARAKDDLAAARAGWGGPGASERAAGILLEELSGAGAL